MKQIDSLYLHFPFCAHLCNYCDFFKRVSDNKVYDYEQFQNFLEHSFTQHESLTSKHGYSWSNLKTFYIGGGTPSLWGAEGSLYLKKFLDSKNIKLSSDCEFTLEVNPKTWDEASIDAWKSIGVNRFSIGVQSLNPNMIKYLDRFHTIDDVYALIDFFSKRNENFSMDFMLGLPNSILESRDVEKELREALKYQPKHFSIYILTVKNNYPHFDKLPDEDYIHDEYLKVADILIEQGYNHYEVSNFTKPGFESQHNLNYWRSKTVAALGPSATGFLAEDQIRYKWKVNKAEFDLEVLTAEEFRLEKNYMGLRSEIGINPKDLKMSQVQIDKLLDKWEKHGYLKNKVGNIQISSSGYLMLDSLMDDIFILENEK